MTKQQAGAEKAILSDTLSHNADPLPPSSLRDARAVRSAQALGNALLALIERKPLEQVTVREIAAEAGVHYATFFRHHPTKEALLDHIAAEQIHRLVALALPGLDLADTLPGFTALCDYVNAHRILWTALLTGGAAGAMRTELLRIARELAVTHAPKESFLPVELAVNCSVSLIFETLAWWLAQPPGTVKQETVAQMLQFQIAAIQQPKGK